MTRSSTNGPTVSDNSMMIINHLASKADLLSIVDAIHSRLQAIENEPQAPVVANPRLRSPFLHVIPPEVRNTIYELLLVKTGLGEVDAIHPQYRHGASRQYNLSTSILRTCQIYNEASEIMYAKHCFAISCIGPFYDAWFNHYLIASPLTRYMKAMPKTIAEIPNFNIIRNRCLILSRYAGETYPLVSLLALYRERSKYPLDSVKIQMLGLNECSGWKGPIVAGHYEPHVRSALNPFALNDILSPLKLLRNVGSLNFEFCDGEHD
ncbi:hypothetical protein BDZ45DRAFT_354002 [Acephala macrosclerotiorum]|nr:hypothetical protein BDZ45DRAFT_354002 [Acephala macrosclerotiorum]